MRILYVTNDLPWPLTSGYLRHYHFIRALSARHAVTLLSLVREGHGRGDVDALRSITERIAVVPATLGRPSVTGRARSRLRALRAGGDEAAIRLGEAGAELAAAGRFDVLLVSGKRTFPVLRRLPPLPLVADLCDATSSRIRLQIRHAPPARWPILALEYAEVRRVERALLGRAAHVLFASVRDREALLGPAGSPARSAGVSVIPNGVDLEFWRRRRRRLGRDEIVLTGAMDYPPNTDAALGLIETVLPLVRREIPTAGLSIVGRDPTPTLVAAGRRPGVRVTGYVDDVRPYLEGASVFAVPLRFGAGIQNKVLEAMAMEVPVVASPLAADGLRAADGERPPIDVASTPEETAQRIVERLRRAGHGEEAGPALRSYVAEHFDWTRNAGRLERILLAVAEGSPEPPEEAR